MQIRVLAFAHLREALGQAELAFELPANATAGDAWAMLAQRLPALAAAARLDALCSQRRAGLGPGAVVRR